MQAYNKTDILTTTAARMARVKRTLAVVATIDLTILVLMVLNDAAVMRALLGLLVVLLTISVYSNVCALTQMRHLCEILARANRHLADK